MIRMLIKIDPFWKTSEPAILSLKAENKNTGNKIKKCNK